MFTYIGVAQKPILRVPCFRVQYFFKYAILQPFIEFKIFIIKVRKYLFSIYLVYNAVFFSVFHVNAVKDDIFSKTI